MHYCLDILIYELLIIEINKKLFMILPIISKQKKDIKKDVINKFVVNKNLSKLRVLNKKIDKPFKFNNYKEIVLYLKDSLNLNNSKFVDLYEINLNQNYNIKKSFLNSGHFDVFLKKNKFDFLKIFKMLIKINHYINDKKKSDQIKDFLINSYMFFLKAWKTVFKLILPKSLFLDFFEEFKKLSKKKKFGKNAIILDIFIDFIIACILIIFLKIGFNMINKNYYFETYPNFFKYLINKLTNYPLIKSVFEIIKKILSKSYLTIFIINYRLIMSFFADIIYLKIRIINFITKIYSHILNFVKIRARDYNLLLNDLSYSPKIKVK